MSAAPPSTFVTLTPATAAPIIGIRDSGVGGLTVAREIKKLLPHARLLYFADTAHVPYGDRTPGEVRHLALSITNFLIENGAQLVVFACNTSSAYALQIAKHKFQVPLIGMIEPGARAALAANQNSSSPIGVLATQATVQSRMYARWIEGLDPQTKCIEVACPPFVPLVESEQTNTSVARKACKSYLQPLLEVGAQTIVLGCTHYPLLCPMLDEVAREYSDGGVHFVDPALAVAREAAKQFEGASRSASPHDTTRNTFFVSGEDQSVRRWITNLLDEAEPDVRSGPIFTPPEKAKEMEKEIETHASN